MTVRRRHRRPAFTLLEMIVVVAVLLLIGGVLLPTLSGLTGNQKVKGAGDAVKARLLEARLAAMDQGRPYVFSISPDGLQMRVAPDETIEAETGPDGLPVAGTTLTEAMPPDITLKAVVTGSETSRTTADGYTAVAIFQPDGTCNENSPDLQVLEDGVVGVVLKVRGITGAVSLNKPTANGGTR